ncbi:alpha-glucosidase [Hasllibacter halocynthiae]|uniref:Alpha-glucosidase n=1 Tax=Hasllibacter halocynthiae TaxID=595589 RepID=A0A2T0X475_9RHOB|nr:alpha-amylase family glycosyl hydrolase [Hasllibacter halocynthiae]PRY93748.1 alpha-glucosidase [Hasllibacter halocynthiae]
MAIERPRRGKWPAAPVIYEVYPRSFFDTDGSGEGDLKGIAARMGYVADLGVDAIWIAPFFLSPMFDGGYDVQDHALVNPRFGTMADFDAVVRAAHDQGLLVMIDQVLNHTSHRHAWFAKSVEREGGYDDWYIWRDPKPDGTPPNNWLSQFGPPAWTWSHRREQYYAHQFLDCQPNLNLRNDAVKTALRAMMRGWRERGVDGFRFDAITSYMWDEGFRDNPPADPQTRRKVTGPSFNPYTMQDHVHDMMPGDGAEWGPIVRGWAGEDAYLLGEITSGNQSVELVNRLCGPNALDAAYTTDLAAGGMRPGTVRDVCERLEVPGSFLWWLSSHDQPRPASAHGDGLPRDARFLMTALALMPGPWLIYQGEELGLPQPFLDYEEDDDPLDRLYWPDGPGRQGARVPIPWAEGYVGFGFTAGTPWLTMRWGPCLSVAAQEADEGSTLAYVRRLVRFRKKAGLATARVEGMEVEGGRLAVHLAGDGGRGWIALMNFGSDTAALPEGSEGEAPVFASSVVEGNLPARTAAIWER